ncbi:MAG: ankyrin repeat domain-containing protein [Oligoflexia bacterium]|nr:ankyrin repeat domain-containing protein [Oligoflexia bacterium]
MLTICRNFFSLVSILILILILLASNACLLLVCTDKAYATKLKLVAKSETYYEKVINDLIKEKMDITSLQKLSTVLTELDLPILKNKLIENKENIWKKNSFLFKNKNKNKNLLLNAFSISSKNHPAWAEFLKALIVSKAIVCTDKSYLNDLNQGLLISSKRGDVIISNLLLEKGANPIIKNKEGKNAFTYAQENNSVEIEKMILRSNPTGFEKESPEGKSVLIVAIEKGYDDVANNLLDSPSGSSLVNKVDNNDYPPFQYIVKHNRSSLINKMLQKGGDKDDLLGYASLDNNKKMVQIALDSGADVNATPFTSENTPIIFAAKNGYAEIAKLLLEKGADPLIKNKDNMNAIDYVKKNSKEGSDLYKLFKPFFFDDNGINLVTELFYDPNGYDRDGFNIHGFNRSGINKYTATTKNEMGLTKMETDDRNNLSELQKKSLENHQSLIDGKQLLMLDQLAKNKKVGQDIIKNYLESERVLSVLSKNRYDKLMNCRQKDKCLVNPNAICGNFPWKSTYNEDQLDVLYPKDIDDIEWIKIKSNIENALKNSLQKMEQNQNQNQSENIMEGLDKDTQKELLTDATASTPKILQKLDINSKANGDSETTKSIKHHLRKTIKQLYDHLEKNKISLSILGVNLHTNANARCLDGISDGLLPLKEMYIYKRPKKEDHYIDAIGYELANILAENNLRYLKSQSRDWNDEEFQTTVFEIMRQRFFMTINPECNYKETRYPSYGDHLNPLFSIEKVINRMIEGDKSDFKFTRDNFDDPAISKQGKLNFSPLSDKIIIKKVMDAYKKGLLPENNPGGNGSILSHKNLLDYIYKHPVINNLIIMDSMDNDYYFVDKEDKKTIKFKEAFFRELLIDYGILLKKGNRKKLNKKEIEALKVQCNLSTSGSNGDNGDNGNNSDNGNLDLEKMLKDNLVLTHVIDRFPNNGVEVYEKFSTSNPVKIPDRTTLHHTINHMVEGHESGNWDCHPYIILSPASDFKGEIYGGKSIDLMTLDQHTWKENSIAIVPEDELNQLKLKNPGFLGKWKTYKRHPFLIKEDHSLGSKLWSPDDSSAPTFCGGKLKLADMKSNYQDKNGIYETLRMGFDRVMNELRADKKNILAYDKCAALIDELLYENFANNKGHMYGIHYGSLMEDIEIANKNFQKVLNPKSIKIDDETAKEQIPIPKKVKILNVGGVVGEITNVSASFLVRSWSYYKQIEMMIEAESPEYNDEKKMYLQNLAKAIKNRSILHDYIYLNWNKNKNINKNNSTIFTEEKLQKLANQIDMASLSKLIEDIISKNNAFESTESGTIEKNSSAVELNIALKSYILKLEKEIMRIEKLN